MLLFLFNKRKQTWCSTVLLMLLITGELDAGVKFKPSKLRRVSDYQTRFGTEHQTSNSPVDYNSLYQHRLMKAYDGKYQKTSAAAIEQVAPASDFNLTKLIQKYLDSKKIQERSFITPGFESFEDQKYKLYGSEDYYNEIENDIYQDNSEGYTVDYTDNVPDTGDRTVALPEVPDLSSLTPSDLAPILLTSAAVFALSALFTNRVSLNTTSANATVPGGLWQVPVIPDLTTFFNTPNNNIFG
ncbi:uncharacterized protein LOC111698432 [Eurytemora carolleeae]|uniref:uncharacterized protein LOC111698432 n=1 Tax=Eurytemora carolleeae TaxID=1294199 RepID=UPI000C763365|nr:uncharacterized protein LOC111698432 [Eurytemora carolleeae]|eukprot:XP_023324538.1 uncharacterized protein LOC111698432 [Eurytemora affinis]